jgi:hypothetical protein
VCVRVDSDADLKLRQTGGLEADGPALIERIGDATPA